MKRTLLLTLVLALFGLAATAAADEVYVPSKTPGTTLNYFPFDASYGEWRYQLIIHPKDLGRQAFTVTDIAFNPGTSGGLLCSLFEVRMGHTTVKATTIFAVNLPNPTTVLSSTNFGWPCTASTWCPIGLTGKFNYDGVSGLTIEVRYKGGQMKGQFRGACYYPGRTGSPHDRVGRSGVGGYNATSGTLWPLSGLSIRITAVRALITPSGTGKIGTTLAFNLSAPGEAGQTYQAGSSLGQGPIPLGTQSLPLSPDELLKLSTGGLVPALFQNYAGKLDTSGAAVARVVIPNIPALKGVRFYTAFLTLDLTKPLGIGVVTPSNVLITIS